MKILWLFIAIQSLHAQQVSLKAYLDHKILIIYDSLRIIFPILVCLATMFATLDHTLTLVRPKAFAKMDLTFSSVI